MMWRQVDVTKVQQQALDATVTGAYSFNDEFTLFVMRPMVLAAPYIGGQFSVLPRQLLRRGNEIADSFQRLLVEPQILAEADPNIPGSARFLRFLGFIQPWPDINFYQRSLQ